MFEDRDSFGDSEELKPEEVLNLIIRYEQALKEDTYPNFPVADYSLIIVYYLNEGKYEQAIQAGNIALEKYPYSLEILFDTALVQLESGNYELAEILAVKCAALDPNNEEVLRLRAACLDKLGRSEEAIEFLKGALEGSANRYYIYQSLGIICSRNGKAQEGVEWYRLSLLEEPQNAEIVDALLVYAVDNQKFEEVKALFLELIQFHPLSDYAWLGYGNILQINLEFVKALEALDNAIALNAQNPDALVNKGNVFMNLGKYAEAYECFLEGSKHNPDDSQIFVLLGASIEQQGKKDAAIKYFQKALKLDRNNPDAWYGVGSCLISQDRFFESLHYFYEAVKLDESNAFYWKAVGKAEYIVGNDEAAETAYQTAANYDPDNERIWLEWSELYFEDKDFERALDILMSGIDELPTNADLWYRACVYSIYAGAYKQAINYLENALVLDYAKHTQLYSYFDDLESQKTIFKIIEQFKIRNNIT